MPFTVIRQNERSTRDSGDTPYWVSDETLTPGVEMDRAMAIEAVLSQGAIDSGTEASDYDFERESHKSAIIRLRYQDSELNPFPLPPITPPVAGSLTAGFNALSFKPVHKIHSLGTVWRKKTRSGDVAAPDFKGLVDVQEWRGGTGARYGGYTLELPPETDTLDYVIPNGEFTREYRGIVRNLLYKVHDGPGTFFGEPAGTTMLVRAQSRQRTNDDWHLSFGFSQKPNGHRKIGDLDTATLDVPEPQGHDLIWGVTFFDLETIAAGISVEVPYYRWLYCERIWERGDLNELDLPGSTA